LEQDNGVSQSKKSPLKNLTAKIIFGPWKLEDSMETYEIRILRLDGSPSLITERKYLNAAAAITAGKLMAGGRQFEVWNDDYCVYAGSWKPDKKHSPIQPAA